MRFMRSRLEDSVERVLMRSHEFPVRYAGAPVDMYRRLLGSDYPGTDALRGLGEALLGLGQPVPAIAVLEASRHRRTARSHAVMRARSRRSRRLRRGTGR
jgi:hypothetical protein